MGLRLGRWPPSKSVTVEVGRSDRSTCPFLRRLRRRSSRNKAAAPIKRMPKTPPTTPPTMAPTLLCFPEPAVSAAPAFEVGVVVAVDVSSWLDGNVEAMSVAVEELVLVAVDAVRDDDAVMSGRSCMHPSFSFSPTKMLLILTLCGNHLSRGRVESVGELRGMS